MKITARICIVIITMALLSSACIPTPTVDTKSIELASTAVMETAIAVVKQTKESEVSEAAPTPTTAATVEPTAVVPTDTPIPTETPLPTVQPTATEVPTPAVPCNKASFVKDVSIPDGQEMKPEESFIKTWRITNAGSCTWTSAYQLVYSNGERMSAPASVNISGNIQPGASMDISVQLISPKADGSYTAYFLLKASDGTIFGMGNNNNPLSAVIKVKKPTVREPLPTPRPEKACEVHDNTIENMSVDGRFDVVATLNNTGSKTWSADFVLSPTVGRDYLEDTFYGIPSAIKTGQGFSFRIEGYDPDLGQRGIRIVWELKDPNANWETYCQFETLYD